MCKPYIETQIDSEFIGQWIAGSFSQIEAGEMELTLQRLKLKPIVERVCGALESRAHGKQQILQIEIEEPAIAVVDAQAVEQILTNLVTNAIKYSPKESCITIRAYDCQIKNS